MTNKMIDKFQKVPEKLYDFAYVDKAYFEELKNLAQKESWENINTEEQSENNSFPVLKNYIFFTYQRLAELYNSSKGKLPYIVFENEKAIINTGLQTPDYKRIYMVFKKSYSKNTYSYYCSGVYVEHAPEVMKFSIKPDKAVYITKLEDLLYNPNLPLIANTKHILSDERNVNRLPEDLRNNPILLNAFEGALTIVKRKVELNYRTAIPQYHKGKIQLLLPLCLLDTETPNLVLVVSRSKNVYRGNTCLTLDMAYNNARLLAKPENNWLSR